MMNAIFDIHVLNINKRLKWLSCLMVVLILGVRDVNGQCPSGSGEIDLLFKGKSKGKLDVNYMLVANGLPGNAVSLGNLTNGEVDVSRYPNAKLRIKIVVKEIRGNHIIRFTNSSFRQNIRGFYRSDFRPRILRKKGDEIKIEYSFNESQLNGDFIDYLAVSIPLFKKGEANPRTQIHCNSRTIKVINVPSSTNILKEATNVVNYGLEASELLRDLRNSLQAGLRNNSNQLCEKFYKNYYKNDKVPGSVKNIIDDLCRELSSSLTKTEKGKKTSGQYRQEILSTRDAVVIEKLFKDYSKHYDGADPNYHEIYYQVFIIVPDGKKKEYGRKYIDRFPDGKLSSFIQGKLDDIKRAVGKVKPKDPDQKAWNETMAKVNQTSSGNKKIEYYVQYLENWKKYKPKANDALALLREDFSVDELNRQQDGRKATVIYKVSGTENKEPKIRNKPNGIPSVQWNASRNELTVQAQDEKKYHLEFFLPGNDDKEEEMTLDLSLPALVFNSFEESGDNLLFNIIGGKTPYQVQLRKKGGPKLKKIPLTKSGQNWSVVESNLGKGLAGEYTVCVFDSNNTSKCTEQKYSATGGYINWLIFPLILLILAGAGFMIYRRYQKDQKADDSFIKELDKQRKSIDVKTDPPAIANKEGRDIKKKIKINRPLTTEAKLLEAAAKGKESIAAVASVGVAPNKVLKKPRLQRVGEYSAPDYIVETDEHQKYRKIEVADLWEDSIVRSIFVHQVFAARVHNFVFEDKKDLLKIQDGEIPEIGGFILGRQKLDQVSGKYDVSFRRFVEIESESSDTTQITFGRKAWSRIDTQLETYKEDQLEIVGWFHTHPGWGVFLSRPDLNTHDTIFEKPFQIAMEIDSMKAPHDVGFFTRKENLKVNNQDDVKSMYMDWDEFRTWLKMK